ncbi:MAG TPA: lantibiotic dehydratase [Ktedonosporobacter sp.]|jgi:thiopeptide-type bacteriocin biosynthesis protein|nr:lantibiotic dehydratase [Ktedonosporobacter sp.]
MLQTARQTYQRPLLASSRRETLYEPLEILQVRSPLFPVEAYLALAHGGEAEAYGLHAGDHRVQRALAVGSLSLLDELEQPSSSLRDRQRSERKLLRYLIRMATRPTPYGLFAGVGLARFGAETDLELADSLCSMYTRPDMAWLFPLIRLLESIPAVRIHLRFVANTAAYVRRGRIFLLEPFAGSQVKSTEAISLRATGAAMRALALARQPVSYATLVELLLASTPGATLAKVEALIATLWKHSLLISHLRPPLTIENPARYLAECLAEIPAVAPIAAQLLAYLEAIEDWDASSWTEDTQAYRLLLEQARRLTARVEALAGPQQADGTPKATTTMAEKKSSVLLQVDTTLHLATRHITASLGDEVARAAELMLRLSPLPRGFTNIQAYRQAFLERYGDAREVPLLEMLDPQFGLGVAQLSSMAASKEPPVYPERQQELLRLALDALRERKQVIQLNAEQLKRLETTTAESNLPASLDINAFVAASSAQAVDRGDYLIVIGPNMGALQAGRYLGRFAHILGEEAQQALTLIAEKEALLEPDLIHAEVVYQPRDDRMMNVVIRPAVRRHEILYGVMPGVEQTHVIPLDELVVGVRDGRFYLRWATQNREVRVCTGHMLSTMQASAPIRFLSEMGQDQVALSSNFQWGACADFPFLPRIQVGRVVLALAHWRISSQFHLAELAPQRAEDFPAALQAWRERWDVPRYVYLSLGDNRLLLDLTCPAQVEELRASLHLLKNGEAVVLEEALPGPEHAWMPGPNGHYLTEFVISLVRRPTQEQRAQTRTAPKKQWIPAQSHNALAAAMRLQPPGSEWLYVKLYCAPTLQEELLTGPLRVFVLQMLEQQFIHNWFFIRYADPEPHIRLRFQGDPQVLVNHFMPDLCRWCAHLMTEGSCLKFVFDVYDREIERYGGPQGIHAAEAFFCADSAAVAEMLYLRRKNILQLDTTTLAVLSTNELLAGLALSPEQRLKWCREVVSASKASGPAYRQRSVTLRSLLGDPDYLQKLPGGEQLAAILAARNTCLAVVAHCLSELAAQHALFQLPENIYRNFVHMHYNRLHGSDPARERQVLELLLRTLAGLEKAPLRAEKQTLQERENWTR